MANRTLQGRESLRRKAADVGYIGNPLGEWSGRADGKAVESLWWGPNPHFSGESRTNPPLAVLSGVS